MGQKTNPTIFSLSSATTEWKSKYIEKNVEESSLLLHKNVKTRKYLDQVFKLHGLLIHSCKIQHNQTTATFLITFLNKKTKKSTNFVNNKKLINYLISDVLAVSINSYLKNKIVVFKTQNLSERFKRLIYCSRPLQYEYKNNLKLFKRFLKKPLFKELIYILIVAISKRGSAKLIAETVSYCFTKQKKRHGFTLFILKKTLETLTQSKLSVVKGIKIVITGRFNGAPRSNKKILIVDTVPLQSFDSIIDYYEDTAYTQNGTFGIKVWTCEKKKVQIF